MASSKKSGSKSTEEFKQEERLQAVVIADSFNVRFAPLTLDRPRTLLPLVNVPLLDYTLEFLLDAGVQHVIIFCCSHADKIKKHVNQSKWSCCDMEVLTVVSDSCMSVGDALRDLEAKSVIRSDFVLVYGDLVSNAKLKDLVDEHRRRRQQVKGAIMTMVHKTAPPGHRSRQADSEFVVAVKASNQRVIGYQRLHAGGKKFVLQRESFESHGNIQIRHDLLDCHIAICAPAVLQLMADNFDYETTDDLIRGVLVNEEVLDVSVFIKVLEGSEYATRAADPVAYHAVSQDVMSRWTYPLVPDRNTNGCMNNAPFHHRHNVYLQPNIVQHRGSRIADNVAVGASSIIGDNSILKRSVVGKNCILGKNVRITDSYIFDNVEIKDDCVLSKVIVDVNVTIGQGCHINGSIIGAGACIKPNSSLSCGTRVFVGNCHQFDGMTITVFDKSGNLYAYQPEQGLREFWDTWGLEESEMVYQDGDDLSSGSESDDEMGEVQPLNEEKLITDEMAKTLERAVEENISSENIIVEINSIKHAYGVQIRELNRLIMKVFVEIPLRSSPNQSINAAQYFSKFKVAVTRFLPLLKNYFRSRDSQKDLLCALEESAPLNDVILTMLPKMIHLLYDEECDVLSEQVILEWWNLMEDGERTSAIRKSLEKFIQWLNTADDEDSDE